MYNNDIIIWKIWPVAAKVRCFIPADRRKIRTATKILASVLCANVELFTVQACICRIETRT